MMPNQLPEHHSGSRGNIKRMLHAELRDLDAAITTGQGVSLYSGYFVTENNGQLLFGQNRQLVQA